MAFFIERPPEMESSQSKNQNSFEFRPMVRFKLANRDFDRRVLKAIFDQENENHSLLKLPGRPSTWGWASRWDIAHRMGFNVGTKKEPRLSKSISRKIRKAFLWLEDKGYLKHADVNKSGMDKNHLTGATRFLLAFWLFRIVTAVGRVVSKTLNKKATSRTPDSEKKIGGMKERMLEMGLNPLCLIPA